MSSSRIFLGGLPRGSRGTIVSVGSHTEGRNLELSRRMMEIGLIDGASFEIPFDAPFSHDPIAVKVRGALIALRRSEANLIEVTVKSAEKTSEGVFR